MIFGVRMMSIMKVLIYARVSRDPRGQGRSVDQQVSEAVEWAAREGWTVVKTVTETGSASRYASKNRARWEEVLAAIRGREVEAVLTWEASRATRDLTAYANLRDACCEHGVRWGYSGYLHDLTDRESRFRTGLDALIAEDEAARTSARVRRDVRAHALTGKPHGKNLFGYLRIYEGEGLERRLVAVEKHPQQGPVVREAAARILAGETQYGVAKDFNARGIDPRREAHLEQRKHLGWTAVAVGQMLSTPAYSGLRTHRGEVIGDASWPPLIERAEWEKLQIVLHPADRRRSNDWPAKHLLSGIGVCGVCGVGLRVGKQNSGRQVDPETGRRRTYATYVCAGTPGKSGFHVGMRETHLDEAVTEAVLARLERADFLATLGERDVSTDAERVALLAEIEGHHAWLDEVRERAARERQLDTLFDQQARVQPKIKAAQQRLEALAATDPSVLDLARTGAVREAWERLAIPGRRRIVRALVVPRVMPVPEVERGRRGINLKRIDLVWHR